MSDEVDFEFVMDDMPENTMTVDVRIGLRYGWRLRLRLWLGTWLLSLAARVLNSNFQIDIEE